MKENVVHVACPKCGAAHELRQPATVDKPMWAVECGCRHKFAVYIDVGQWPARRVQNPIPLRLAERG